MQARRGELVDVLEGGAGAGSIGIIAGRAVGLVTWLCGRDQRECEIRALAVDPDARGRGVGRALLAAAEEAIQSDGVGRAWLVTTNDNLAALALYQKAGWRLAILRPGAVDQLRQAVKPSIPAFGHNGIPLRDELELEKLL
jgi:ribosomal protein S18 acetylase RimI-like enzyme